MAWQTPKINWGQPGQTVPGVDDFNRIEENTRVLKDGVDGTMDALSSHVDDTNNPHSVDKAQVGLGNVENKSAATIRQETGQLRVEVVSSFPAHADGKIIAHTGTKRAYVSISGEWV